MRSKSITRIVDHMSEDGIIGSAIIDTANVLLISCYTCFMLLAYFWRAQI